MKNKLVSLKDVNVVYTNPQGEAFNALKDINLEIEEGDYIAILGTSGSGKTTLSNVIGMLNGEFSGKYYFDGLGGHDLSPRKRGEIRGEKIGFIFQDYVLLDYLTAIENVALALQYSHLSKKEIYELALQKLKSVGLEDKIHHKPSQLSGGQKQRVSVARALIKNPRMIIADEPTGALDHNSRIEVLSLLQELNQQGVTIITVTHSVEDAQAAKRVIKVEKGAIVSDQLQRYRERFFGKILNFSDPQQVLIRKMMVLEHVNLSYGIKTKEDFIGAIEDDCPDEVKFKLLSQLKSEWLEDEEVLSIVSQWLETSDDLLSLQIALNVLKMKSNVSGFHDIQRKVDTFFKRSWNEETCLFFFKRIHDVSPEILKGKIQLEFFFDHDSNKVRATAIYFLRLKGFLSPDEVSQYTHAVLTDEDHRVRSNMLDYLYAQKDYHFEELFQYNFSVDPSPRVRAIWSEILIRLGKRESALSILTPMIFSGDLSSVLAAVWVLAKDYDFDMLNFLSEKIDENPALLGFVDDILGTYDRVKMKMMDWRQSDESPELTQEKDAA